MTNAGGRKSQQRTCVGVCAAACAFREDGAEEVKGVEWALVDLRRQRSKIGSLSGQGLKRRKRWAVVQDSDANECLTLNVAEPRCREAGTVSV